MTMRPRGFWCGTRGGVNGEWAGIFTIPYGYLADGDLADDFWVIPGGGSDRPRLKLRFDKLL